MKALTNVVALCAKGHPVSQDTRDKIRAANSNPSDEVRASMGMKNIGREVSQETREKRRAHSSQRVRVNGRWV